MNNPVILSGYDLVAKGITKSQATLPELGLKDVIPNGSWLEAKQIQSAIDARMQLIAAERIEKSCILSHAEWKENLMLAEVVQKSGGHWQFMGHNVGKTLYLYPEEALFLIEINSLLLKHNDVKVSLQQAYSLLLRDKNLLLQYKVYGTLSRWGFKVFRHTDTKVTDTQVTDTKMTDTKVTDISYSDAINEINNKSEGSYSQELPKQLDMEVTESNNESIILENNEEKCNLKRKSSVLDSDDCETNGIEETIKCKKPKSKNQTITYSYKIEKHKNRQLRSCNVDNLHKLFDELPSFLNTELVTIKVPDKSRPYTNRRQRKKARDNAKHYHFESIIKLAARIKNLVTNGQVHIQPLTILSNLIETYNSRYGFKIKLSDDYEIVLDTNILDTIELDDEGEQIKKKPRVDSNSDTYTINFNNIKQLAERLKVLENDDKSSARHRRAFSNLIKTFNKSYNADIYVTDNYKVLDRRFISLESSSDSDCMIDENANSSGKKVRNPFNILKRLSEKRNKSLDAPGTSSDTFITDANIDDNLDIQKNLSKEWIPDDNNFGRPEISGADDSNTANLFYEFMKFHPENYENWLDLKGSFFSSLEETADFFRKTTDECVQNRSLVAPEDCVDIVSVLKKLSIIKSHDMTGETNLTIDFDVYNRDVQNFKKTKRPVPHFRVSCLDESATFPSGEEIATLHAKYKDDVRIVFAIVGNGTINFVQINPFSLPNHISSNVT
ncbi:PREDICTED: uncharacterized protein LOC106107376 isoform X2 [Papilio polytes]|uniref:uncharacterized protein LOC106107376 isoform X2 n=1 Tax=Papilio polytes TaxID=76194 RepID=UPI0006761CE2|nr:PREDICTED: uncharacterized protein LOC106107376 isoform X2 [Papilio polytes]